MTEQEFIELANKRNQAKAQLDNILKPQQKQYIFLMAGKARDVFTYLKFLATTEEYRVSQVVRDNKN